MATKVLVVENEVLIADDLCNALTSLEYEVLEPAFDYQSALIKLKEEKIDIVILDIQLGGKKTGMDLAEFIKENLDIPYIYLSSHTDKRTLELAKSTMPYAYLVKPFDPSDVLMAIEIALNNHSRYGKKSEEGKETNSWELTPMEKVIVRQVAENKTTKEIADELCISVSTVKNHRHNICVKLNLPGGTHSLAKWAMENKHILN